MTHDELLAEIDAKLIWLYSSPYGNGWKATRAVVELHKPRDITLPNGEWGINCIICDGWQYPCATIQAIEKELG